MKQGKNVTEGCCSV